jgi:DNA polymerase-3 subunit epsilon
MTPTHRFLAAFLACGVAGIVAVLITAALLRRGAVEADANLGSLAAISVLLWCVIFAALWVTLWHYVQRPLRRITGEVRMLAEMPTVQRVDAGTWSVFAPLAETVNQLAGRVAAGRKETERAVADATSRAEEQKSRLEALLRDLSEGVVVCNLDHQVLLYNQMVARLLGGPAEFGLGRPLFSFLTREPVLHALDRLTRSLGGGVRMTGDSLALVCATADARALLQGRMSLIFDDGGKATGYVLTLADVTSALIALGKRDALLRQAIEGVRGPIANLRAAAETLAGDPLMAEDQRRAFERIMVNESTRLSERLAELSKEQREVVGGHGTMSDLHSADLINCVARRLEDEGGATLTMIGRPQWLHGDSYALMLMLALLIRRIGAEAKARQFDLEARASGRGIHLDVIWPGEALPAATLESWLDIALEGNLGGLTVRNVLERHHSDMWSEAHATGSARLRVPLPAASAPASEPREPIPERAEFYDFDLLAAAPASPELGARALRNMTYVVFDLETTGLQPAMDDIVSIAGVRIVNGRILTGETFNRLVNPKRPIPPASIRFHGITDDMVRDKPPIEVVLPQFKAFAADAVLVAHNIAFDLSFLKLKESASRVRFDNPILDTMLLSACLHEHTSDHTLDGLARRYGVGIEGRHTALGDSMITAAVLTALFDTLEGRGIHTFGEAVRASRVVIELKARQARFATAPGV